MLAGAREVVVVSSPDRISDFDHLLGDGTQLGMRIQFAVQEAPRGIAHALLAAEDFTRDSPIVVSLGDNLFHGIGLGRHLQDIKVTDAAHIFSYEVAEPQNYGVLELAPDGRPISLHEKPTSPPSNLAVPGLYFYPPDVFSEIRRIPESGRGEFEVTDLNLSYLRQGRLSVSRLPRGTTWLDAGTPSDLLEAGIFVRILEQRQGLKVGCLEEIAWRNGWIGDEELAAIASSIPRPDYGAYLEALLQGSAG